MSTIDLTKLPHPKIDFEGLPNQPQVLFAPRSNVSFGTNVEPIMNKDTGWQDSMHAVGNAVNPEIQKGNKLSAFDQFTGGATYLARHGADVVGQAAQGVGDLVAGGAKAGADVMKGIAPSFINFITAGLQSIGDDGKKVYDVPYKTAALEKGAQAVRGDISQASEGLSNILTSQVKWLPNAVQAGLGEAFNQTVNKGVGATADKFTQSMGGDPNSSLGQQTKREAVNAVNLGLLAKSPQKKVLDTVKNIPNALGYPEIPPGGGIGDGMGAKIIGAINKVDPNKAVEFQKMTGKLPGQWLQERGIIDSRKNTIPQLVAYWNKAKESVDNGLAKIPTRYKDNNLQTVLTDQIKYFTDVKDRSKLNIAKRRLEALNKEGLNLSEINAVKRTYEATQKLGYQKDMNANGITRATNLDAAMREFIEAKAAENGFTNLKDINKETQGARFLADQIYRKMNKQSVNDSLGLVDKFLFYGGIMDPKAWAALGLKKIALGEKPQAALANLLSPKTTKGIPEAPLRTIELKANRDALNKAAQLRSNPTAADINNITANAAKNNINTVKYPNARTKSLKSQERSFSLGATPKSTGLTFDQHYANAAPAKGYIDNVAQNIVDKNGGFVAKTDLKTKESALRKVAKEYQGDHMKLADIARNTIVHEGDLGGHINGLKSAGARVRIAKAETDALGYSGVNAKIDAQNGHTSEIQVNSPLMIFAKEQASTAKAILGEPLYNKIKDKVGLDGGEGHVYYDKWRRLDEDSPQAKAIAKKSKAYYNLIRSNYAK